MILSKMRDTLREISDTLSDTLCPDKRPAQLEPGAKRNLALAKCSRLFGTSPPENEKRRILNNYPCCLLYPRLFGTSPPPNEKREHGILSNHPYCFLYTCIIVSKRNRHAKAGPPRISGKAVGSAGARRRKKAGRIDVPAAHSSLLHPRLAAKLAVQLAVHRVALVDDRVIALP